MGKGSVILQVLAKAPVFANAPYHAYDVFGVLTPVFRSIAVRPNFDVKPESHSQLSMMDQTKKPPMGMKSAAKGGKPMTKKGRG